MNLCFWQVNYTRETTGQDREHERKSQSEEKDKKFSLRLLNSSNRETAKWRGLTSAGMMLRNRREGSGGKSGAAEARL